MLPGLTLPAMNRHNKLNTFLIASVVSTVAMTAIAGPQPLEKTVAPAPPSEIDWAGPYIGVNVGALWTNYDVSKYRTDVDLEDQFYEVVSTPGKFTGIATFPFDGHSATESNAIGGGQLGYNFQFGHFVVGAEGGFSGARSERSRRSEQFQINPFFQVSGVQQFGEITAETTLHSLRQAETNWNGYIGGQVGYAWWRLLFYGNGGAAFTDLHVMAVDRAHTDFFENVCDGLSITCALPVQDQLGGFIGGVTNTSRPTEGDVLTGWYAGGGIQYALNDVVRVGAEYRHCDFGDETVNFHSAGPVFPGRTNFALDSNQVTFRVNIMLGRLGNFGP
jgi:opacity protein-like surface antigen